MLKAQAVASPGRIALGEDGGLFVDALHGFPGPHTSRWAPGSDEDRARLILERLQGGSVRSAQFVSSVAVVLPDGERHTLTGVMDGEIATQFVDRASLGFAAIFRTCDGPTRRMTQFRAALRLTALSLAADVIGSWAT